MVFSPYKKLRIVFFHRKGLMAPAIGKHLLEDVDQIREVGDTGSVLSEDHSTPKVDKPEVSPSEPVLRPEEPLF